MVASRHSVPSSVPSPSSKRSKSPSAPGSSSISHYNPSTGSWDGQLPNPDITDQLSPAGLLEKLPENWPSIIERDAFVDLAAVTLNLSACQTAVFRRIAFRAGSASQGCFESQDNMARYLGYKRRAIQMALHHLQDLGLIHRVGAFYGSGKSNTYVPIFRLSHLRTSDANEESPICAPHAQMGLTSPSVCASDDTRMRTTCAPTEGTDNESLSHESSLTLSESQDFCDSENQSQPQFICASGAQMDVVPSADVPECGSCGLPWTYDVGRHRTALQRGMRAFICDSCREAQIAAVVGIEMLATSYNRPALPLGERSAGVPASLDVW